MRETYHFNVIRSKRRSISMEIEQNGSVTIRAPKGYSDYNVKKFIAEKKDWIKKNSARMKIKTEKARHLSAVLSLEKIRMLKKQARLHLKKRLDYYADEFGLRYEKMRLSGAKTRWGSCSGKNTISLNWKAILCPPAAIDYLIVHELVHTKHKHHQKKFWAAVEQIDPEYKTNRKILKQNGHLLQIA